MGLIRLLLAISVIIAHSSGIFGFEMVGGMIAVQTFFIISGFYMSLILNEKYVGKDSYKLFITNRLLRLYPIYWVVALLTLLFGIVILWYSHGQNAEVPLYLIYHGNLSFSSVLFLVFTNIALIFQDFVVFQGLNNNGNLFFTPDFLHTSPKLYNFLLVPQAWTIGIEISFYLIAPFLVRKSLKVIMPILVASILLRVILYKNGLNYDPWTYRFFPCELAFFLLGNVSYRIYKKIQYKNISKLWTQIPLGLVVLFILFYSKLQIGVKTKMGLYFAFFIVCLPLIFRLTQKSKLDAALGELSYPVYISHIFVLALLSYVHLPYANTGLVLAFGSILFSIALNRFIAQPIEVYRQRRVKKISAQPRTQTMNAIKMEDTPLKVE